MKSIILSVVTCGLVAVCLSAATAKPAGGLTGVAAGDTVLKQKIVMHRSIPVDTLPKVQPKKKTAGKKMPKDTTKKH